MTGARLSKVLGGGVAALLLIVLGTSFWLIPRHPVFDAPTGEHEVGRRHEQHGQSRFLLFYPTERSQPHSPYLEDSAPLTALFPLPSILFKHLESVPGLADDDAPPLSTDRPLVLYLHGGLGFPEDQTTLCADLASHGFVVAAPRMDLSGERLGLSPKSEEEFLEQFAALEQSVLPELLRELERDVLLFLDSPESRSLGILKERGVIAIGHSLGGGIAGALGTALLKRGVPLRAWVNLDGHVLSDTPSNTPELHLSQSESFDPGNLRPLTSDYSERITRAIEKSPDEALWLRVPGAGHATFTDGPFLLRPVGPLRILLGTREAARTSRRLVSAFATDPQSIPQLPSDIEVLVGPQ